MKVIVLYTNEKEKKKYEELLSVIPNISIKYLNLKFNRNIVLFSYIRQSDKIFLFIDKNNYGFVSEAQSKVFEYLVKFNDKLIVIDRNPHPSILSKNFFHVFHFNLDDKDSYSILKQTFDRVFTITETNKYIKLKNKSMVINGYKLLRIFLVVEIFTKLCAIVYFLFYKLGIVNNIHVYRISIFFIIFSLICTLFVFSYKLAEHYFKSNNKSSYINNITDMIINGDFSENCRNLDNNAIGRMLVNLEALQEYYSWSKTQSKMSFYLAISLIIIGIFIITVSILLQILFKLSITISIVTALTGTIVEFIAGTALFVYKNSLTQLNHYHRVLHEDERFLSSLNIVNNLSNEKEKDEMIKELIRSEIELNKIELSQFLKDK